MIAHCYTPNNGASQAPIKLVQYKSITCKLADSAVGSQWVFIVQTWIFMTFSLCLLIACIRSVFIIFCLLTNIACRFRDLSAFLGLFAIMMQ